MAPVLGCLLSVTLITQGLGVALHIGATLAQWDDVVSLGGCSNDATLFTFHAQWIALETVSP